MTLAAALGDEGRPQPPFEVQRADGAPLLVEVLAATMEGLQLVAVEPRHRLQVSILVEALDRERVSRASLVLANRTGQCQRCDANRGCEHAEGCDPGHTRSRR